MKEYIAKRIELLRKQYCRSKLEQKLFTFFLKSRKNKVPVQNVVLVQCVEDYYYYALFGQIISNIQAISNVQVEQYVVRNFSVNNYSGFKNFIKNKLYVNRWSDKKWTDLYASYCDRVAYRNEQSLGLIQDFNLFIKAMNLIKSIKTKEELVKLRARGILIGDLIYDTYLRFKPAPTVDLNDFYLIIVTWKALRNIEIASNYFEVSRPDIILQSYSTYIQHGVTARIALLLGIDVYTFGSNQLMAKKLSREDFFHLKQSNNYKPEFDGFDEKELKRAKAKEGLEDRFAGKIDRATSYMKESAYKLSEDGPLDLEGAVVIFLHDFYDSPHIYSDMVFSDFIEWVEFTILELDKNSVKYYLKPHPNQLPESAFVVDQLCDKYEHIQLLSPKITNVQLVESGMMSGITVYGTVAHELTYMGVPVITCGDNPHSSYEFCFEAKSKEEYSQMLRKINTLTFSDKELVKQEVESFYYMHNLYISQDEQALLSSLAELREICARLDDNIFSTEFAKVLTDIKNNVEYQGFINQLCLTRES